MEKGILVVVSGFSGVGKGTVLKNLLKNHDEYALSVSATTRKPRPGETNGKEYFFVSREQFEDMIEEDALIEYAQYVDNYYGTPEKFVMDKINQGINVILEIEIQGALLIKEKYKDAVLVFITAPSAIELKNRLEGRGTESEDVIMKRLRRAKQESEGVENYDYILINDFVDSCSEKLHNLISAEKEKTFRRMDTIEEIRKELGRL